ncbi:expressed unknown protein [Seminavis robusta]|uniref:PX domain-containing protein n=1 Tax=Seminavis robusta TaxID=568900 RepID=A0A9N8E2H6_9STRA|nr:expressed unknown protein [Seminavis robusta]|eukprot:Sro587_g171350.1 n/a (1238) ;mRNA; r:39784-43716
MKSYTNSSNQLLSSFRSSLVDPPPASMSSASTVVVPHQGSLCRMQDDDGASTYIIDICLEDGQTHDLIFAAQDFDFCSKLFAILDTESRGAVERRTIHEFVTLRCPVFLRRDEDLRRSSSACDHTTSQAKSNNHNKSSPTFDEVWKSVVESSRVPEMRLTPEDMRNVELGVESWMVFCRFIALAQYLEAKRRFSARHLQQTMRHRNSPRGSELVVVDVPPPEPPVPLSREQLANYERKSQTPLPLPELDLDHSLLAAHESSKRRASSSSQQGIVKISLFGSQSHTYPSMPSSSNSHNHNNIEFKVSYMKSHEDGPPIVVRRSMEDMKWLNDTFTSHKVLGGTLCGRILPPFPRHGKQHNLTMAQFQRDNDTILNASTSIKNTTGGAIAAAAAGVEILKDTTTSMFGLAKTLWKTTTSGQIIIMPNSQGIITTIQPKKALPPNKPKAKPSPSLCLALPESYYNPNSPAGRARQIERYLNYLLEHPALSTSFPLNTILKASQSGLEAAKQSLEECLRLSKEVKEQTPQLVDGKTILPFWGSSSGAHPSLSWVRTAAQAAMALKVHGILETTGMQSASARLQHASLPNFDHPGGRQMDWGDEEQDDNANNNSGNNADAAAEPLSAAEQIGSFEQGVVSVLSELQAEVRPPNDDDGYDLLPLPIPAPERRILSAGYSQGHQTDSSSVSSGPGGSVDSREARFHYGTQTLRRRFPVDEEDDARSAFLGDISVDEHIDKLREVIGSVDNTLSRCLASGGAIGRARRERLTLHLDIVQGFDSWKGLRGKFIQQRALLKGVSGIEQSSEVYEESDLVLIDDMSWQTSLANSAVSAAEDVRSAVRAARTAENAKAAASAAAYAAQSTCDAGGFPSIDEARAAQTRASIAQSHAFHAAVVEHEAKAVKRRATLALAHDVKCWNVHRKREMLQACVSHARSQLEATRRAVDAWSCLRDGFIGSTVIPAAQTRKAPPSVPTYRVQTGINHPSNASEASYSQSSSFGNTYMQQQSQSQSSAVTTDTLGEGVFADLFGVSKASSSSGFSSGNLQNSQPGASACSIGIVREASTGTDDDFNCIDASEVPLQQSDHEDATATIFQDTAGKPVIVAVDHNILASAPAPLPSEMKPNDAARAPAADKTESEDSVLPFAQPILPPFATAAPLAEVSMAAAPIAEVSMPRDCVSGGAPPHPFEDRKKRTKDEHEIMSESMQSLVDGLMSWGGQFEGEDVLPTGMAASIAFESSDTMQ